MTAPNTLWVAHLDLDGKTYGLTHVSTTPDGDCPGYTRRDPAALAADPMVMAMQAAAMEGAVNEYTRWDNDWDDDRGFDEVVRALIPAPASAALEAALAQRERETWEKAAKVVTKMMNQYAAEKGCTKTANGRTAIFYGRKLAAALRACAAEEGK